MVTIKKNISAMSYYFNVKEICPYCNKAIYPEIKATNFSNNDKHISCIVSCPACSQEFFIKFRRNVANVNYVYDYYEVLPYPEPQVNLPADFQELFPEFYKIYTEAAKAESYNLLEICGMGYRKALTRRKQFKTKCLCRQSSALLLQKSLLWQRQLHG